MVQSTVTISIIRVLIAAFFVAGIPSTVYAVSPQPVMPQDIVLAPGVMRGVSHTAMATYRLTLRNSSSCTIPEGQYSIKADSPFVTVLNPVISMLKPLYAAQSIAYPITIAGAPGTYNLTLEGMRSASFPLLLIGLWYDLPPLTGSENLSDMKKILLERELNLLLMKIQEIAKIRGAKPESIPQTLDQIPTARFSFKERGDRLWPLDKVTLLLYAKHLMPAYQEVLQDTTGKKTVAAAVQNAQQAWTQDASPGGGADSDPSVRANLPSVYAYFEQTLVISAAYDAFFEGLVVMASGDEKFVFIQKHGVPLFKILNELDALWELQSGIAYELMGPSQGKKFFGNDKEGQQNTKLMVEALRYVNPGITKEWKKGSLTEAFNILDARSKQLLGAVQRLGLTIKGEFNMQSREKGNTVEDLKKKLQDLEELKKLEDNQDELKKIEQQEKELKEQLKAALKKRIGK